MKRIGMSVCALACSFAFALSCSAQANPWNGSWKIDPGSLKYNGPTFSVTADNEGYTITRDGKAGPKTICDGASHDNPDGTAETCTKEGSGYVIEVSKDGKRTNKITVTMSPDDKRMTRENEIFPADGSSPFTMTTTERRISGGPGVNGEWKQIEFKESQDQGILSIEVNGDSIAFKETDADKPMMSKLDGTPTKFEFGGTMETKMEGPRTLKVIYKDDAGKVRRENTFVLSPNGKTITETDVTPAPSASTMSMKFHKM